MMLANKFVGLYRLPRTLPGASRLVKFYT
jgi:hypothetical protein